MSGSGGSGGTGGVNGTGGTGGVNGTGGVGGTVGTGGVGGTEEVLVDSSSGLIWQNTASTAAYKWEPAVAYCEDLAWAGKTDWRLPTISELRSLVRGCAATMTDGACEVTDSCLDRISCWSSSCVGCGSLAGPGEGGCYWDASVLGDCRWLWSASPRTDRPGDFAWQVYFDIAHVEDAAKGNSARVRCVRTGL
jgi:hypothetical protein